MVRDSGGDSRGDSRGDYGAGGDSRDDSDDEDEVPAGRKASARLPAGREKELIDALGLSVARLEENLRYNAFTAMQRTTLMRLVTELVRNLPRRQIDGLKAWSREHRILHHPHQSATGETRLDFKINESTIAHLAVFLMKADMEVPEEIGGFIAARDSSAGFSRKQASLLQMIGPVVRHHELYEPSEMRATLRTAPETVASLILPKGSIKSIEAVYGAQRRQRDGSSELDRLLTTEELRRLLFSAAVLGDEIAGMAQLQGGGGPVESKRAFAAAVPRLMAILAREAPLSTFDIDDPSLNLVELRRTTVRHYLDSPLHRALLPWKRYKATLGDHEAHSAGCVRCLRTLYEPEDFYCVDSSRTTHINTVNEPLTQTSRGILARMQQNAAWAQYARDRTPLTRLEIQVMYNSEAIVSDAAQQLVEVPSGLIYATDEYPPQTIYAGWIGQKVWIFSRWKNPHEACLDEWRPFGTSKAAWNKDWGLDTPPLTPVGRRRAAAQGQARRRAGGPQITAADEAAADARDSRRDNEAGARRERLMLYRYNNFRANSNLCYECGRQLDDANLRLLDGYRPMEMRLTNPTPTEAVARLHNRGLSERMSEAERALVQEKLEERPGLEEVHLRLIRDGQAREYTPPTEMSWGELRLPFRYLNWARNWTKNFPVSDGDLQAPPLDAITLLRMGILTPEEYATLFRTHSGATSLAHKVNLEVAVGSKLTGLLQPSMSTEEAHAKHKKVLDSIEFLLNPASAASTGANRLKELPREVVQTLQNLAIQHHVAMTGLENGASEVRSDGAYDPDEPMYEWHRLVQLKKQKYHPGFDAPAAVRRGVVQARSVQQSKWLITMVMHKRATFNEKHNEHVLMQMARSVDMLFASAEHTGRLFRFGVTWNGAEMRWVTWVPRKDGAETTGMGHYMEPQDWLTKDVYEAALVDGPTAETASEKAHLLGKFWDAKRNNGAGGGYVLPSDHPYARKVKGQILPADEYQTDTFDEVMLGMHANVGCEIGPVARLFHFHMLLDVKHISKIQLDRRAFSEYFLACWSGSLFNGECAIKDTSGNPWIPPHEKLYMDLRLQAEDEIAAAMDAYVQKQSMNYMAAGLRSIAQQQARRDKERRENDAQQWFATTRAAALISQPRRSSAIMVNDGTDIGLRRRSEELTNRPAGSFTGQRMMQIEQMALIDRRRIVQADARPDAPNLPEVDEVDEQVDEQWDEEEEAAAQTAIASGGSVLQNVPFEPQTEYERARLDRIAQVRAKMTSLGLGPGGDTLLQTAPRREPPRRRGR